MPGIIKLESFPPPREEKKAEQLWSPEQVREFLESVLRRAGSEDEAKREIKDTLDRRCFMYFGPAMTWESGPIGAVLERFERLGPEQRKQVAGRVIRALMDDGVSVEEVLREMPSASDGGIDLIDAGETETRGASVSLLFPGATEGVEVDCLVRVNPKDN